MCGITGFIDFERTTSQEILNEMVATLLHRGPDDRGAEVYHENEACIGLSHSRLSIIDLSEAGHQPMHYQDLSIVFNGEIYNYREIKSDLIRLGHKFSSSSDTEVILHAFDEWGTACVDLFIGMYSFVLISRKQRKVYFFRDRAGVKPLYIYQKEGLFLFASELKAFHKHPKFEKIIDQPALEIYFDYGYIPSPYCIFKNCFKLSPGYWMSLDLKNKKIQTHKYWSVHEFYKKKERKIGYTEAIEKTHDILKSACSYRMVADVPVGVFLSGGYDSTLVTAILQSESTEKIKTFTIGFEEGNNEAPFAKKTASYLGTDHYEYYCKMKEAQEIIPKLPYFYDEPFADSSAIPTTLVSKMAREKVAVALSADAGDELFAGYNSYSKMLNYSEKLNMIPDQLKFLARTLLNNGNHFIPRTNLQLKHKLRSISYALNTDRKQQIADLVWKANSLPIRYYNNLFLKLNDKYTTGYNIDTRGYRDELSIMLAVDYEMYLENDILTKVDRATMSVSLEGREPLLDHRILEFAASLPSSYKFDGSTGKRILKDIVHKYVPREMMDRPKTGFSLPIYNWLMSDLSYLLEEYLNEQAINQSSYLIQNLSKQLP